ncbi:MAG: hypothetical protein M1820_010834 [Bogoriella megaspora]|nr:MAG: hypothetical protein M1820_010834 [Bogoriella megaspora]
MSLLKSYRFWGSKTSSIRPREKISLICRGKTISRDELFQYTNGRFLAQEKHQRDRRYIKFDVDALCDIAASTGPSVSPVRLVEKLEGGFSKALRIQKEDGTELIAKIPLPIAGPARYTTASEVAVLEYVRSGTNVPVPTVYAWSSDKSNPVGAEYIIMEHATGVQLYKVWDELQDIKRLALIKRLVELESELMALQFPAYGSLYHRRAIPDDDTMTNFSESVDQSSCYRLGRSCDPTWLSTSQATTSGPWPSLTEFGTALAKREIHRILLEPRSLDAIPQPGTPAESIALLETTVKLMQIIGSHHNLVRHAKPTLSHTDLHMGNIFVSKNDPSEISAIIDWQCTQIAPLFLQARWPRFLSPPKNYPVGVVRPKLPENYEDLNKYEKELAEHEFKQATAAKAYELRCGLDNKGAYWAMEIPIVYRELFNCCANTREEGPVPLRSCLIEIHNSWQDLGLPGSCPYEFREEDIQNNEREFQKYDEWDNVQKFARKYLATDAEGWISPEVDFPRMQEQNRVLFDFFAQETAGQFTREHVLKLWPFAEGLS